LNFIFKGSLTELVYEFKRSSKLEILLVFFFHNSERLDWKITNPCLRPHLIETKVDILNLQGIFYFQKMYNLNKLYW